MFLRIQLACILALIGTFFLRAAAPPNVYSGLTSDEQLLSNACLATDNAALFAFFRSLSPSPVEKERRTKLILDLGNNSFRVRTNAAAQLVREGPGVIPLLRQATKNPDREVVRQARRCLAKLPKCETPAFAEAAARLLARRDSAEAIPVLLRYLPIANDEAVIVEVRRALVALHRRCNLPDKPLLAALADKTPACRAAAAFVLGQSSRPAPGKALTQLLDDPVGAVRLEAALALVLHKDKRGIPTLLALLADSPLPIAWQAERMLLRVAADKAPPLALQGTATSRGQVHSAWKTWWKETGSAIDLATCNLKDPDVHLLYTELEKGRLVALDSNWKECWDIADLNGPVDVQILPSGRFLIAENHGQLVTERDRKGRIVWQHKTEFYPIACWRLDTGNTVITTHMDIMEITPTGKKVWSRRLTDALVCSRRLRDKRIAVLQWNGLFPIWTAQGKDDADVPSEFTLALRSSFIELPTGNFLVAGNCQFGHTVEVSLSGELIWSSKFGMMGSAAVYLPNGHLCFTDPVRERLLELDRAGKKYRQKQLNTRPWHLQIVR